MEYYLCRAMEIVRLNSLNPENVVRLQVHEKKERLGKEWDHASQTFKTFDSRMRRCLFPWEIQECFGVPILKEHYGIPDDNVAQDLHNKRLRSQFRVAGLVPAHGDLNVLQVDEIHAFDEDVLKAEKDLKIDLVYQGGETKRTARKRFRDE